MGEGRAPRTQSTVAVDVIAVAAVLAGLLLLALRVWRDPQSPAELAAVLAMLATGYVMADLLTGFVHWFCDTFFEETTPIIGPHVIASFREHHRDPLLMTRHGLLELTGSSFRGLAPVLGAYLWLGGPAPVWVDAFVFAMGSGAVATNLLHRWAHEVDPPPIARLLHASGLVLTPRRHARHHAPPYAAAYCVTTGWLNPICERLGVWTRAEAALVALGAPLSGDRDDRAD
jgi:ubiquitin-conjugating enzyme E2 variant